MLILKKGIQSKKVDQILVPKSTDTLSDAYIHGQTDTHRDGQTHTNTLTDTHTDGICILSAFLLKKLNSEFED